MLKNFMISLNMIIHLLFTYSFHAKKFTKNVFSHIYDNNKNWEKKGVPLSASPGGLYTSGRGQLFICFDHSNTDTNRVSDNWSNRWKKKFKYTKNAFFQLCSPGHSRSQSVNFCRCLISDELCLNCELHIIEVIIWSSQFERNLALIGGHLLKLTCTG